MRLTADELEVVRTPPQQSRLNLFVYRPGEVMRATVVNEDASKGDMTIRLGDITPTGTAIDILADTTLWVGTAPGMDDVGHVRIRSSSFTGQSGTLTVAENSHIPWEDGMSVTALKYWEVWPIYPRIIQNPSNAEDVIFYKDYNEAYTNQNNLLGSFIKMGSHRARVLDPETNQAEIFWSATGSVNVRGEIITDYLWSFGGGTPTGSISLEPGNVVYTTPGDYITSLQVTADNGATDTSYRYVSIKEKIGYGSNTPVVKWEMKNMSGSRGEAGYTADFIIHQIMEIHGNDVVMLVSDDWYGDTHVSLGNNTKNEPYMFFVGHVERDSIKYDWERSTVEFTAVSITSIMKQTQGFSVSVESKAAPSTWYELYNMNCKRALYHYLKWHSTVPMLADLEYIGADYAIQYFDSDRTSLFDAVDEFMRMTMIGNMCSDRLGNLYIEVEPMAYPDPTGTFVPVMDIDRRDWMREPSIEERQFNDYSYMEYGGIYYRGPNANTFVPYLACAPGRAPAYSGGVEAHQGLALSSQSQLNALIGHVFANKNAKYPTVSMDLSGNYRNIDIAPYEALRLTIHRDDTVRNIELDGLYLPDMITWEYDHRDGLLLASLDMKQLVNGFPGDTITIRTPNNNFGSPEFDPISDTSFTPVAVEPVPTGTSTEVPDPEIVVLMSPNYGILYCTNFNEAAPVWQTMNDGLGFVSGTYIQFGKIVVCPDESLYLIRNAGTTMTDPAFAQQKYYDEVWYCPQVGGTWSLVADTTQISGNTDPIYSDYVLQDIDVDYDAPGEVVLTAAHHVTPGEYDYDALFPSKRDTRIFRVTPSSVTQMSSGRKDAKGDYRSGAAFAQGNYYLVYLARNGVLGVYSAPKYSIADSGGAFGDAFRIYDTSAYTNYQGNQFVVGAIDNSLAIVWGSNKGRMARLTAGIPAADDKPDFNPVALPQALALSPSGERVMGNDTWNIFTPYRSPDGGKTWNSLGGNIPAGMSCWDNCGDEVRWIFGGGTNVKYTRNFGDDYTVGDTNYNKEGNLSPDFPLIRIIGMRKVR